MRSTAATEMSKTLSEMVSDFFEFDDESQKSDDSYQWKSDDDDETKENSLAETKAFWESQHQLLQEALSRRSSTEIRIQKHIEQFQRNLKDIADGLRSLGYNSSICKSKWRKMPDIPSGEHTYLEAVVESKNGNKSLIRFIVEPNFRAEFEMARANAEYKRLVSSLPEVFVGKGERLKSMIKIICSAAKKCIKDNKMHMAPWRKHKYMQSKWFTSTCERIAPEESSWMVVPVVAESDHHRAVRPRASMLTFDLHCTTVEVV